MRVEGLCKMGQNWRKTRMSSALIFKQCDWNAFPGHFDYLIQGEEWNVDMLRCFLAPVVELALVSLDCFIASAKILPKLVRETFLPLLDDSFSTKPLFSRRLMILL